MSVIIHEMDLVLEPPAPAIEEKAEPQEQRALKPAPHDIRLIVRHQADRMLRILAH